MVEPLSALGVSFLATFIPLYLGVFSVRTLRRSSKELVDFLVATSVGILFWFFLDVMNDAALLDVNQGFGGNYTHIVLAMMFALGLFLLFGLEKMATSASRESGTFTFVVAGVVALGIGFHAFGEGIDIGSALSSSVSIFDTIGGLAPGIAYVLHKFLEGLVVGIVSLLARRTSVSDLGLLGIISGIPTIVGFFVGLASLIESTYFFALGGTIVVYASFKLIPRIAEDEFKPRLIGGALLGFYLMYTAGLFHG